MINEDDQFFIPRHIQRCIQTLLREVPEVAADLAAAIACGDGYSSRISFDPKVSMGERERPLAWNVSAQDAADELGNELSTWARHVCESRAIDYDGSTSVAGVAHWLDRNIISLALTEGCEQAHDSIQHALRVARRSTGMSAGKERVVDEARVALAAREELNKRGCSILAKQMGGIFSEVTQRRVDYLYEAKAIAPVRMHGKERIYRFGDVLDAHERLRKAQMEQAS